MKVKRKKPFKGNIHFPPNPHNNSLIFILKSSGMVAICHRYYFRSMLLFALLFLPCFRIFSQTDQLLIIGQEKRLDVKINDITIDNITFENLNDHNILTLPTNHINYLKLRTVESQKYFTKDLLLAIKKYNSSNLVWYGADFTMVKINDLGEEYKYTNGLFRAINNFILDQNGKFYSLWTCIIPYCLSCINKINYEPVNLRNDQIKIQDCFKLESSKKNPFNFIRESITNLEPGEYKEGIGMMFFYKSIDKSKEQISGDLVFFDITSKEIILSIGDVFKSDGISMEWHWSKGLRDFLNDIRKEGRLYKDIISLYNYPTKN
ncbi:MAG: hypothetical protein NTU51_10415 [Bacteroidetes bacterium]|nr:hypothetical protein [Bacteroidota bacterium]